MVSKEVGQVVAAPGSRAHSRPIQTIGRADQAAPKPSTVANRGLTSDAPAVANPDTVAGPTNGPARALASRPTTLTVPDSCAITGVVARWAASGTATASASGGGNQPRSTRTQRLPHQMIPALASTESANP